MKKNILLIITGSIAAYKSVDLIRLFKKADYQITPVMTKGAEEFITPLLVSSIAGQMVLDRLFCAEEESKIGHINLSRTNDAIIIAPATADFIAKMANGLADDLASNIVLAANKPIFIAPAMNEKMWKNCQTQKNLQTLRENGVRILEPKTDILACGEYGVGKMTEPAEIFSRIDNFFNKKKIFAGKKVIITAGATYEPIDPVRFIGNYSSGKQGIAIAESFYDLGAEVILVAGNISENINLPAQNIIRVKTASEMLGAVENNLTKTEIFISAAAVADFRPMNISLEKIKKTDKNPLKSLELVENVDILQTISSHKDRPKIVVGFAAESSDLIKNAKIKLEKKNCDFVLANNVDNGAVFGSNYNQITILSREGKYEEWEKMTKKEVSEKLIEKLVIID
ncbi:MAG: phosphopantothenoylcysteine decarboxylase/phosphopantothenate--cysteine ligase [Rickettsiales bacterium]|jgi:phosphopantothenoylcysteine decarboxylase/phosphopantothenate--cysteine ligase